MAVTEPNAGWYERGSLPFHVTPSDFRSGAQEKPACDKLWYFKLVDLRNPHAAGPVRAGDPVWLQIGPGIGLGQRQSPQNDDWRMGGVVGSQVYGVSSLDRTAVSVDGRPPAWHHAQERGYKQQGEQEH